MNDLNNEYNRESEFHTEQAKLLTICAELHMELSERHARVARGEYDSKPFKLAWELYLLGQL